MRDRFLGAALAAAVLAVPAAHAFQPGGDGHGSGRGAGFERMDTDGDGAVSYDEFRTAAEARAQRRFERLDADGDGSVTRAEAEAARERIRSRRAELRERRGGREGDSN